MAVVKINAIEVPEGAGRELEKRFANRLHAVDNQPGFLGFELLRPVAGEQRYFVVTRWESAHGRWPAARACWNSKSYHWTVSSSDERRLSGSVFTSNVDGQCAATGRVRSANTAWWSEPGVSRTR